MATREENLKKLNDELEKLSDEQLEQVAGGTSDESFELMDVLKAVAGKSIVKHATDSKSIATYLKEHYNIDATINFGIYDAADHDYTRGEVNIYSRNGEKLTHRDVLNIIRAK